MVKTCVSLNYLCVFLLFSQCSASCGSGVQKREVYCRFKGTGRVGEDLCVPHTRPPAVQPCHTAECTHYTWVAAEWGKVSGGKKLLLSEFLFSFALISLCEINVQPK